MKLLINIVLLIFFTLKLSAQTIDKLQAEQRIDSIFQRFNNTTSPGAAVTILQNGKVVAKKSFGMANLEHAIPFTHKSPVRLVYSMGREFMSVGLAMMEAEGLLKFEDKVKSYFPKLPEWSKEVTIQDLLNHASGFDDEWSLLLLMTADMRSQVEDEQVLTLLYNQPKAQVEPGKGYMYNNTDIALLRFIMEKAARQSLPDYLKKKLFEPLGMSSTFMNDDIEMIIPGLAENYYGYNPFRKARFIKFSPGGNYRMVTSAEDLEKWANVIDDKSSIVSKAYTRLYKDARAIPVVSPEKHYVFGHESRVVNGTEVIYQGGVDNSFYLIRIPSQLISIVGLGNAGNFSGPIMQLARTYLPPEKNSSVKSRYFPNEKVKPKKEELSKYPGRYFSQRVGYNSHIPSLRFYDLRLEGDSLNFYIESSGNPIHITPFGNDYFKDMEEDMNLKFTKIHPDSAMKMEAWQGAGENPLIFLRAEGKKDLDKETSKQYTGRFYSSHLDYYLRIIQDENGKLIIKRPTVPDAILDPNSKDQFIVEQKNGAYSVYMMATFTKNKKGEIDGFTLQDSRMMHHRFDKVK